MAGKKGMKHFPKELVEKIKTLKLEGLTHQEIAESLGFEKMQIKQLLERERLKERKIQAGIALKPKGRPRTRELTKKQELQLEVSRLERENDLLRSFLRAAGRM